MFEPRRRRYDRWRVVAALVFLLLIATSGTLFGQEQVQVTINQVDSAQFPRLVAYVTVVDGQGRAIAGLPAGAFSLAEDGIPIADLTVDSLENMGEPILLALVIDTSGSMGGRPLADTKSAATQLVNDLGPADQVTLLAFGTDVEVKQDFTADKATVIDAIEALTVRGDTALNDAIYRGSELLAARPPGRKALIVLTDGHDTASVLTIEDAVNQARQASIPVYLIGFGPAVRPDVLSRVSTLTGGQFFQSPSSAQLGESFKEVARLLRLQYVMTFESALQADDSLHTLRVGVQVQNVPASAETSFTAVRRDIVVEMISPTAGEIVGGLVTLKPRIDAPAEVAEVEYWLDGNPLAKVATGDFAYEWDTTAVTLGIHTLTVRVTDKAGNQGQTELLLEVAKPVQVAFVAPDGLRPVRGQIPIELEVTALAGVAKAELAVDGVTMATATAAPWVFDWDTSGVQAGRHTLTATAYDVAGRTGQSELEQGVGVIISLPHLRDGETVGGFLELKPLVEAPADVVQVDYLLDGARLGSGTPGDWSYRWDTAAAPFGEHTLTIRGTDAAGNSDAWNWKLITAPPVTVSFVAPAEDELNNLSGEVVIEVQATAIAGVDRVEFLVDNEPAATAQTPPYRFTWNTADVDTGPHTIIAQAYDVNGLSAQAVRPVSVAIRGASWGFWLVILVLALSIGAILPLAARRRRNWARRMEAQVAARAIPRPATIKPPPAHINAQAGAWLEVEEGPDRGQRWPIEPGENVLGRKRSDCDIIVSSTEASRRHAVIRVDHGVCTYWDLEPTNPTLINESPVKGEHELNDNDRIQIGDVVMRFIREE